MKKEEILADFEKCINAYQYKKAIGLLRKPGVWKKEDTSQRALEICVKANAKEPLEYLIKFHRLSSYLPIAEGSLELFSLCHFMELNLLDAETASEFYFVALTSPMGEEKLELLKKEGLDLSVTDENGVDLISRMESHIEETKYQKSRKGKLEKLKDERILAELRRMKADGSLRGSEKKKRRIRIIVAAAVLLVLGLLVFAITYERFSVTEGLYQSDTSAVDTENAVTETLSTETADTE